MAPPNGQVFAGDLATTTKCKFAPLVAFGTCLGIGMGPGDLRALREVQIQQMCEFPILDGHHLVFPFQFAPHSGHTAGDGSGVAGLLWNWLLILGANMSKARLSRR